MVQTGILKTCLPAQQNMNTAFNPPPGFGRALVTVRDIRLPLNECEPNTLPNAASKDKAVPIVYTPTVSRLLSRGLVVGLQQTCSLFSSVSDEDRPCKNHPWLFLPAHSIRLHFGGGLLGVNALLFRGRRRNSVMELRGPLHRTRPASRLYLSMAKWAP